MSVPDWSKLITVNYKGGLSGDFFCNLLADNFDKAKHLKNDGNRQKYIFRNRDVFEQKFKSLTDIRDYRDKDYRDKEKSILLRPFSAPHDKLYSTVYEMYKDEPLEILCKEISELLYSLYYNEFSDGKYKISNFHNVGKTNIKLSCIFPDSKNIILTCNDQYYPLSRILFFYKNILNVYDDRGIGIRVNKEWFHPFIEAFFFTLNSYKNEEYPINIYELIFCGRDYDKDLSDFLQTSIKLNKKQIQKYRDDHIEIFKKFNVDLYKQYEKKEIYGIIVDVLRTDERFRFD